MSKDYYKILGVEKGASADEVKRAFRKLAHQHHPDKSGGDEAKFKEVNEAYQVLGDETKRKQYDQFGADFQQQGGFGGNVNWDDFMRASRQGGFNQWEQQGFDTGDLGDILGSIFGFGGGGRSRSRQRQGGRDIQVDVDLTFEEAVFGVEKQISFYSPTTCKECGGSGAEHGSATTTCSQCQGQGVVDQVANSFFGMIRTQAVCPKCHGEGKEIEKKCKTCGGDGRYNQTREMTITIPGGIDDGQAVRLSGRGEAGARGTDGGDLYVTVHVKKSDKFKRDGQTILSEVTITPAHAALGTRVDIQTLDGEAELKVPAGTQSGTVFRLKGRGVPSVQGGHRGDQHVTVTVAIPKKLSKKAKKLYEELVDMGE